MGTGPVAPGEHAGLADWLAYQERLHPVGIELGLSRVADVAGRLGLPAGGIRTLTVGGTNGKGSSATLASLIYRAAGYRVGLYTSPHLLRYNERVAIDGVTARDDDLCRAFRQIEAARACVPLTYFEYATLAALWLFREAGVQVQVLEVGLGGRLDAVNLVDADAALLTNVGLDHLDWLGPDREAIGAEKAGIFRSGRPAVCTDRSPPRSVLASAQRIGAQLRLIGRDFDYTVDGDGWSGQGEIASWRGLPMPGLQGRAQLDNAAGVLAAVRALDPVLPVSEAAVRGALPQLLLPGRFQKRGRYVFDVAHNTEAAAVLAENLLALRAEQADGRRIRLLMGMLSDKPVEAVAAQLAPAVDHFCFAGLPGPRGLPGETLRQRARAVGVDGPAFADVAAALSHLDKESGEQEVIVVCGSFLTVSAALLYLERAAAHG